MVKPSDPIVVVGFDILPSLASVFSVVSDASMAKRIANERQKIQREQQHRQIKEWTLDGVVVLDYTDDIYILNVNSASVVTVEFESTVSMQELTFSVVNGNGTIEASDGTNILTSPASVIEGTEVTFTATADIDYRIKEWTLDGVIVLDYTDDIYILNVNSASVVTVEFESSISVVKINNNSVSLHPNPTTGMLRLDCDNVNSIVELIVSTVTGKVLIQKSKITQNEIIDLSSFQSGIYIINLKTKDEVFTTKIIKQN